MDRRTDVYSLGATLYELCAGEPPFRGPAAELLHAIVHVEAPSLRRVDPSIPRDLRGLLLGGLDEA